jgi:hypothetical protein
VSCEARYTRTSRNVRASSDKLPKDRINNQEDKKCTVTECVYVFRCYYICFSSVL